MADRIDFDIKGLDELQAKIKSLSADVQGRTTSFALGKAADVVKDAAKGNYQISRSNDPDTPENVELNIVRRKSSRGIPKGDVKYRVGVLGGARDTKGGGAGNPGGDTFYWRFLELGTERVRARPFMRPALTQAVGNVLRTFTREWDKSLDRALKRAGKK